MLETTKNECVWDFARRRCERATYGLEMAALIIKLQISEVEVTAAEYLFASALYSEAFCYPAGTA